MHLSAKSILASIKGRRILVVGDVMLDKYVWGDSTRLSPEAPVPVVRVSRETAVAGGAANVALNLASLGASVSIFGRFGSDSDGAILRGILGNSGVKIVPGCVSDSVATIVKSRVICRRQQVCRLDREAPPADYALGKSDIDAFLAPAAADSEAILLSDYAKGLLDTSSIRSILALPSRPSIVTLDPKPRSGIDYSGVSLMTPNRSEALKLAGLDDLSGDFPEDGVCAAIHGKFAPENLVVTLGADGMLLSRGGKPTERIPTFAREVFDVSGAGDTVIAAMTAALAAGVPIADAARFANTAAGIVVAKLGTAVATPGEIEAAEALA